MKQLELVLLAGFVMGVAGCVARIDASATAGDTRDNVKMALADEDAGAAWAEAPDASKKPARQPDAAGSVAPKPVAAAPDASSPPTPPTQKDAGAMPPPAAMAAAGSMSPPPMAAMPAAGSMSPPADAGTACDFRGLVQMKCGNAACHGAPGTSTGLDLTSPQLAMRVAGRKGPSACASKLLIDPENPSQSALYLKVAGPSCGSQMPLGGTLTPSEQACFLSWIEGL